MNVFRSLCGSLIGAAIATTIYFFVKPENLNATYWFPVLAGILTGLGAGMLGGSNRGNVARLVSGGLAAAVAGITMIGVDVAPSLLNDFDAGKVASAERDVSGKLPSAENKKASETSQEDGDSDKADVVEADVVDGKPPESGDTSADGTPPDGIAISKEPVSDGEGKSANEFGADRTVDAQGNPPSGMAGVRGLATQQDQFSGQSSGFSEGALAKLEWKRKVDRWLQVIMPGIGILLAYQFARGFRDTSTLAAK